METLIVTSEVEIKKWMREVIREELSEWLSHWENPPSNQEEPLLTRREMAAYLHISFPTLKDWINRGLPCVRKGRRVLFQKSAVLQAMKEKPIRKTLKNK